MPEEEGPKCPECGQEIMEYVDAADLFDGNPGVKDVWYCNWCGYVMPV